MSKGKNSSNWVEFQDKIVYIYEKIFENDKDKLIYYFSDQASLHKKKSRKKTIENWLEGRTQKPNGFYLYKFKISEYELNSTQLFTHDMFERWSFEQFKERVDTYLMQKESLDLPNEMRYIYFFNAVEHKLSYFEITYPNSENPLVIELNSPIYTSDMTYKGKISTYNNMTYITVKNQFDYMHYIFKNNVDVYRKELKVFGVAQCVDAPTHEPKSYMALLTSTMLTAEEERNFSHKINFSNLMIADDFTHNCRYEKEYFLENFSEKIYDLSRDIHHYTKNDNSSKDMYFDIILEEFLSYITLLEKAFYHSDYAIDHKRQSILFALEEMCKESKEEATIVYLLNRETLNILDGKNSIMEMQLKLVREGRLTLTYLFIVENASLLTQRSMEQIEQIEKQGITVMLTDCMYSIYTKILLVKGKDFAIYKRRNEKDENNVTRNATTIESLSFEVEHLLKKSISLTEFIVQNYALNGTWYNYAYSSKMDAQSYQTVELNIQNSLVTATFPNGNVAEGDVHVSENYTLLLLENSVLKICNVDIKEQLFRVSIIGKEQKMYHRDVLLFGLLSREKLTDEQVFMLLSSIHEKDDEPFRLKISNDFDSTLAYFDMG